MTRRLDGCRRNCCTASCFGSFHAFFHKTSWFQFTRRVQARRSKSFRKCCLSSCETAFLSFFSFSRTEPFYYGFTQAFNCGRSNFGKTLCSFSRLSFRRRSSDHHSFSFRSTRFRLNNSAGTNFGRRCCGRSGFFFRSRANDGTNLSFGFFFSSFTGCCRLCRTRLVTPHGCSWRRTRKGYATFDQRKPT